jgi:hypothetical protein
MARAASVVTPSQVRRSGEGLRAGRTEVVVAQVQLAQVGQVRTVGQEHGLLVAESAAVSG